MKKILLLGAVILGSLFSANAQGLSCGLPTTITTNGTNTATTYNGTYTAYCLASVPGIKAKWYKYVATANGHVTISSDLPANNGVTYTDDTRVSILKGTCAALECVATSDDVSTTNFLTTVTFPVAANTTYYIQWDNRWYANEDVPNDAAAIKGFQFTFNFTASSCLMPEQFAFYLPDSYTTTSAALYWDHPVAVPTSYDVDYSASDVAPGSGTIINVPAGSETYGTATITGLPASAAFRYYVRSNCGSTQSPWQGPFFGALAVTAPLTNTFSNAAGTAPSENGFLGDFTLFNGAPNNTPANYADGGTGGVMYTYNDEEEASDMWYFSKPIAMQAGETATIKFKTRLFAPSGAPNAMPLDLTVGTEQFDLAHTPIQTFNTTSAASYTQHTGTFTAPEAGTYYFGWHNNAPIGTNQTFLFLDTVEITSVLGTNDFLTSKLSVYPNPATNVINITNAENILVKGVDVIDINGRTVKSVKYDGVTEAQINVADLAAGMYIMNISSDNGTMTKKVVKN